MPIKLAVLAVLSVVILTGCIFRDRSEDYQRSGSIKPIEMPEGVSSVPLEPLYKIPEVAARQDAFYSIEQDGFVVPRPDPMSAENELSKIKIQQVGAHRWILADASTSQVWPLTQSFLSSYDIEVAKSLPASGLIQTDWVHFKNDDNTKSAYQIRIEKGVRPETSEVHVLQHEMPTSASTVKSWPQSSTNAEREAWLLEALANSLALGVANNAASLLGQSVGGPPKAELYVDQSEPALRLRLGQSRAWATVAHALSKEGFKLWDEDSNRNVFYVQYLGGEKKRNWFMRLIRGKPDGAAQETPYRLAEILNHLAADAETDALFSAVDDISSGTPLPDADGYLVILQKAGDDFIVKLRDPRGQRLDLQTSKQLLAIIRRNLI